MKILHDAADDGRLLPPQYGGEGDSWLFLASHSWIITQAISAGSRAAKLAYPRRRVVHKKSIDHSAVCATSACACDRAE